ncbi:unnamed protein product [Moneuplotes crassus]|uniref:C2H2-type domain-containing protein n=1 Tax=Euplotes crassus TaxID=5936 RepID=A0AAD2D1K2_EUPCR|nr:unnamed protein product [Moneuplotes crassus]
MEVSRKMEQISTPEELILKILARDYCFCSHDLAPLVSLKRDKVVENFEDSTHNQQSEVNSTSNELTKKTKKTRSINYSVLEGRPYEIIDNPNLAEKNRKLYICKYPNCDKVFKKTWNLVYHFRVHEKTAAYECEHCDKTFIQKANYLRHKTIHDDTPPEKRKKHNCPHCSRKYSCKYNLNAHIKRDHISSPPTSPSTSALIQ